MTRSTFLLPADERIDLPTDRLGVQILCVGFERATGTLLLLTFCLGFLLRRLSGVLRNLADPVGDKIDDVQPGHTLLVKEVDRVGVLLSENGYEHVGARHLFLARRLDVENGALDHPAGSPEWAAYRLLRRTRLACVR